jgi:hypothetical protein
MARVWHTVFNFWYQLCYIHIWTPCFIFVIETYVIIICIYLNVRLTLQFHFVMVIFVGAHLNKSKPILICLISSCLVYLYPSTPHEWSSYFRSYIVHCMLCALMLYFKSRIVCVAWLLRALSKTRIYGNSWASDGGLRVSSEAVRDSHVRRQRSEMWCVVNISGHACTERRIYSHILVFNNIC